MYSVVGTRLRLRSAFLAVLLMFLVAIVLFSRQTPQSSEGPLDIVRARKSFEHPIYIKWARRGYTAKSGNDNCMLYFNEFQSHRSNSDPSFEDLLHYDFSPLLYKKTKWLAEKRKEFRRQLREKGISFDDSHAWELEQKFVAETHRLSQFERMLVQNTATMRVFGQCFLHMDAPMDDASCVHISSRVLPWLLGKLPSVESWQTDVVKEDQPRECVVKQIENKLKGRGIVIPLLPKDDMELQTLHVARLIQVLRATQNTLPIEILYAESGEISKQRKELLINAARSLSMKMPHSLKQYLEASDKKVLDFPQQDILFVNVRPLIAKDVPVSDTFMWTLAPIFTSFEELVMLSTHTIPLEKLDILFDNRNYRETGTFFFKTRALPFLKPHKFAIGYLEVNSLVNDYCGVRDEDSKYFQLPRNEHHVTLWVRNQGYTHLLDESMVVLNKKKTLAGLLMASSLTFYKFLQPKYDFTGPLNPECLWLGIELAGGNTYFNINAAAAAGVLTPPENTPVGSMAQELCSSSWGQVYDETQFTLLYVTTHQLDNRALPEFAPAVAEKLTIKKSGVEGVENGDVHNDDNLVRQTVQKSLLYIESALIPTVTTELKFNRNNEPEAPWVDQETFGSAQDYWCAYDVVGTMDLPDRGVTINYNNEKVARYLLYMDVWMQSPHTY